MLSLRSFLALLSVVAGLFLAGCAHAPKAPRHTGTGVEGTVIYITNYKLPANATIELRLAELDREGRFDREVAAVSYPRPAAMPLEFWLPYQAGLIDQRLAYGIEAKIVAEGRTLFSTVRPIPVVTRGNPKQVEVVVAPVK